MFHCFRFNRIKPSDSAIVKGIKEINKVQFVSTNKANVSRLIDITDLVNSHVDFKGNKTLNELQDFTELINAYNDKFNQGSSLVDDDFEGKSIDYLKERRKEFVEGMKSLNQEIKEFVLANYQLAESKKKTRKTAALLRTTTTLVTRICWRKAQGL